MQYDAHGKSEDGHCHLIQGRTYLGEMLETDPEYPSVFYKGNLLYFKAVKNGSLFAMKHCTKYGKKLGGYVFPQQLDIKGII